MEDGHDLHKCGGQTIDDTIVPTKNFAQRIVSDLRYNSSGARSRFEPFDSGYDSFDEKISVPA